MGVLDAQLGKKGPSRRTWGKVQRSYEFSVSAFSGLSKFFIWIETKTERIFLDRLLDFLDFLVSSSWWPERDLNVSPRIAAIAHGILISILFLNSVMAQLPGGGRRNKSGARKGKLRNTQCSFVASGTWLDRFCPTWFRDNSVIHFEKYRVELGTKAAKREQDLCTMRKPLELPTCCNGWNQSKFFKLYVIPWANPRAPSADLVGKFSEWPNVKHRYL